MNTMKVFKGTKQKIKNLIHAHSKLKLKTHFALFSRSFITHSRRFCLIVPTILSTHFFLFSLRKHRVKIIEIAIVLITAIALNVFDEVHYGRILRCNVQVGEI